MTFRVRLDRLSPLRLGIVISGTLIAILLVTETVFGRWDVLVLRDLRLAIVHCLLMGYSPAAFLYVLKSSRRTVEALQAPLGCTREESEALAASVVRLSRRGLVIFGLIGLAVNFVSLDPLSSAVNLVTLDTLSAWNPATWNAEVAWHRILSGPMGWFAWWLGYAIITVSIRMSRLAEKLDHIDLLDLSPLAPFNRQGLTNALLLIGLLAISTLFLLETGFGGMMLRIGVTTLVMAALAVLPSVLRVRTRIRQAKDAKLRRIDESISTQVNALENSDAGQRIGELADLVAYRGLIENVPEWPFTASTYARLILYMLIPVASWVLGGIVEELVGRALF